MVLFWNVSGPTRKLPIFTRRGFVAATKAVVGGIYAVSGACLVDNSWTNVRIVFSFTNDDRMLVLSRLLLLLALLLVLLLLLMLLLLLFLLLVVECCCLPSFIVAASPIIRMEPESILCSESCFCGLTSITLCDLTFGLAAAYLCRVRVIFGETANSIFKTDGFRFMPISVK